MQCAMMIGCGGGGGGGRSGARGGAGAGMIAWCYGVQALADARSELGCVVDGDGRVRMEDDGRFG